MLAAALRAPLVARAAARAAAPSLRARAGAPSRAAAARSRALSSAAAGAPSDVMAGSNGLTGDAAELYATAAAFSAERIAPHAAKWDEEKIFPEDTLRAAAGLGLACMYVREDVGGSALTRAQGVPIIEALAEGCVSTAAYVTIHNMVAWMIDTWGSPAQREQYLPRMATMELFASYCLTEPNAGSDAASLTTKAVRGADGGWTLTGSKAFISGGGRSDVYVVMARTGGPGAGGVSAFIVDRDTPGLTFGKQERKMGWNSQPTAAVFFEGVRLPAGALLGAPGDGFKYAMKGLDGGRLSIAACSVGGAAACFHAARAHVQVRKQFGKPLVANQAVAFSLAGMATDLTLARMLTRSAAAAYDAGDPNTRALCAMAKRVASEKGFDVANAALQAHGGYGYLKDYPVERFVRDLRVNMILEGANEVMHVILARALLEGAPVA